MRVTAEDDVAIAGRKDDGAELSCALYARTIGEGERAVSICPILNGIWTSFLDHSTWGRYTQPLPRPQALAVAEEMRLYDAVGLATWIGEDFDARVLSALEAHREAQHREQGGGDGGGGEGGGGDGGGGDGDGGTRGASLLPYSIIVESGHNVGANLDALATRLGPQAIRWVQLGPPALEHLPAYRMARIQGKVAAYGVEDYTPEMLREFAKAVPIATAQQEINPIVRPSAEAVAACKEIGCRFVAYGPLLGGLLSDAYLGASRPTPDAQHSKQWDYLASIDAWADWGRFQDLLRVLRAVGDAHGGLPIATVALAYVLQLDGVVAAIVGVRLGLGAIESSEGGDAAPGEQEAATHYHRRHRRATLEALRLVLAGEDVQAIDAAVSAGTIRDGLART